MFEKEAEEYRKDLKSKFFLSEPQLDLACQGFKDGLRKANEWHYVKDGDLPKYDNDVLVLLKDETMQVDYYFPKIGWNISVNADVIAWKEIVLPKT